MTDPILTEAPPAASRGGQGPGAGLRPMQLFRDIAVVPTRLLDPGGIPRGGPLWPDYDHQTVVRHCRNGRPVDRRPDDPERPDEILAGATVWGGMARRHFGHLVAEFTTRLAQSVAERPEDRFLFILDPGATAAEVPAHVWALLEWHGLDRRQVVFVERPVGVERLHVAAQGEQVNTVGPSGAYLDLLEANARRRRLEPERSDILYVGRAGLCRLGQGGHAGEAHLVSVLRSLGVRILDPAAADLRTQLACYLGAKTIVFAEGSAIHGRQLLGRLDQRVVILVRRPGHHMAPAQLKPRCREVHYAEATRTLLAPIRRDGPNRALGIAFYDVSVLMRVFADLGLDLARQWEGKAYQAAIEEDVTDWLRIRFVKPGGYLPGPSRKACREILAKEGLGHLDVDNRIPKVALPSGVGATARQALKRLMRWPG